MNADAYNRVYSLLLHKDYILLLLLFMYTKGEVPARAYVQGGTKPKSTIIVQDKIFDI